MLGSLFEEEEDGAGGGGDGPLQHGAGGRQQQRPCPRRPAIGFSGIVNQGATCYLNTLLQTLTLTPEFRDSLFSVQQNELGDLEDKEKPGAKVRVIPIQLRKLIARLLLKDVHAVSSAELTDSFGWTNREETEQHDVQELNRILFSAVESSLAGTKGKKIIRDLYHGTIVNQIICEECQTVSDREEDFLDLCVAVAGSSGLDESLTYSFVKEELLTDANRYQCSRCSKLTSAVKRARLRLLPPILTISLLRFNFDFVKMERYKEIGKFVFPMQINMAKFSENTEDPDGSCQYELFSVIIHRGSTHGGHYHAYIRDIDGIGCWTHPDADEIRLVPSIPSGEVRSLDVIECSSCELVLKSILERAKQNSGMTIDALCGELVKQTGVSWNKRFKKQHGPITKFLKMHDDLFEYNADANWVSLKVAQRPQNDPPDIVRDSSSREQKTSNRPSSPEPQPGQRWFDFDDVHIHPIRLKDIETQFSGKECAYMLFYRRKSIVRPPEASSNPSFGIPDSIVAEIAKENEELEQQRLLFQSQLDMIAVHVHLGSSYFYSNGSLHPCDGHSPYVELSIDKQKTVSDLLFVIADSVPGGHVGDNHVLHLAKDTPAGLHLYENLTDNLTASLVSCGIQNSSKVFLWDGFQVGGHHITTGPECEPVLLNVLCSNDIQFSSGFPKNTTVKELKEIISSRSGIPSRSLSLSLLVDADSNDASKAGGGGGGGGGGGAIFADETETLAMLKLTNCAQLYASDDSAVSQRITRSNFGEIVPAKSAVVKKELTLFVENHCVESENADFSSQTVAVKVNSETTIAELKVMAVLQLSLPQDDLSTFRLRLEDAGFGTQPPCVSAVTRTQKMQNGRGQRGGLWSRDGERHKRCVSLRHNFVRCLSQMLSLDWTEFFYEDEVVSAVGGLSDGSRLLLEIGRPPLPNQVMLFLCVMKSSKVSRSLELTAEKQMMIGELLSLAVVSAGLESSDWHLGRLNWNGDPLGILDDTDATIEQSNIRHGDHLALEFGRLPPKGFLQLSIYLFPNTASMSCHQQPAFLQQLYLKLQEFLTIRNDVEDGELSNASGDSNHAADHKLIGTICISKLATLLDLKDQIRTLDVISEFVVPTSKFLRLRLLQSKHLGRVLRLHQQTLQKLKIVNGCELGVQLLTDEEDLRENQLLLNVCLQSEKDRTYSDSRELTWDVSQGASVLLLCRAVANVFQLPEQGLRLAKHVKEKFEWIVLTDLNTSAVKTSDVKEKRKKKKNANRSDVRHAPYNLQDGDLIGVKMVQGGEQPLTKDDFATAEDYLGQERIRKEADDEQKKREERRRRLALVDEETGTNRRRGRTELPIRIHVENFS